LCGCIIMFLLCVCIVFIHSSAFSLCFIPIILMCNCRILIKITHLLTYLHRPSNVGYYHIIDEHNAQTPLGRFVVYMLYSQLCNKDCDKSNRWSLGLSLSVASSAVGVPWRIISKSTSAHTKMGHEQNHAPLGVICHPFSKIVSICTKLDSSSLSHS